MKKMVIGTFREEDKDGGEIVKITWDGKHIKASKGDLRSGIFDPVWTYSEALREVKNAYGDLITFGGETEYEGAVRYLRETDPRDADAIIEVMETADYLCDIKDPYGDYMLDVLSGAAAILVETADLGITYDASDAESVREAIYKAAEKILGHKF